MFWADLKKDLTQQNKYHNILRRPSSEAYRGETLYYSVLQYASYLKNRNHTKMWISKIFPRKNQYSLLQFHAC